MTYSSPYEAFDVAYEGVLDIVGNAHQYSSKEILDLSSQFQKMIDTHGFRAAKKQLSNELKAPVVA